MSSAYLSGVDYCHRLLTTEYSFCGWHSSHDSLGYGGCLVLNRVHITGDSVDDVTYSSDLVGTVLVWTAGALTGGTAV